jgi:hypothetical protein
MMHAPSGFDIGRWTLSVGRFLFRLNGVGRLLS